MHVTGLFINGSERDGCGVAFLTLALDNEIRRGR